MASNARAATAPETAGDDAAERVERSVRVHFPAQVEFAGERFTIQEFTANLSDSGMFLPTDHAIPPGTRGTLRFRLTQWDEPFTVAAEVVRTGVAGEATFDREAGIGIRFLDLGDVDRARLQRLVEGVRDGSVVQSIRRGIKESGKGLDQELRRRPMGQKLILATFAYTEEIDALIRDGQVPVLARLLKNPRLRVPHVRAVLRQTRLPKTLLREVERNRDWMRDEQVRLNFSKHPNAPLEGALRLIPQLPLPRLQQLAADTHLRPPLREKVKQLLKERRR